MNILNSEFYTKLSKTNRRNYYIYCVARELLEKSNCGKIYIKDLQSYLTFTALYSKKYVKRLIDDFCESFFCLGVKYKRIYLRGVWRIPGGFKWTSEDRDINTYYFKTFSLFNKYMMKLYAERSYAVSIYTGSKSERFYAGMKCGRSRELIGSKFGVSKSRVSCILSEMQCNKIHRYELIMLLFNKQDELRAIQYKKYSDNPKQYKVWHNNNNPKVKYLVKQISNYYVPTDNKVLNKRFRFVRDDDLLHNNAEKGYLEPLERDTLGDALSIVSSDKIIQTPQKFAYRTNRGYSILIMVRRYTTKKHWYYIPIQDINIDKWDRNNKCRRSGSLERWNEQMNPTKVYKLI